MIRTALIAAAAAVTIAGAASTAQAGSYYGHGWGHGHSYSHGYTDTYKRGFHYERKCRKVIIDHADRNSIVVPMDHHRLDHFRVGYQPSEP